MTVRNSGMTKAEFNEMVFKVCAYPKKDTANERAVLEFLGYEISKMNGYNGYKVVNPVTKRYIWGYYSNPRNINWVRRFAYAVGGRRNVRLERCEYTYREPSNFMFDVDLESFLDTPIKGANAKKTVNKCRVMAKALVWVNNDKDYCLEKIDALEKELARRTEELKRLEEVRALMLERFKDCETAEDVEDLYYDAKRDVIRKYR